MVGLRRVGIIGSLVIADTYRCDAAIQGDDVIDDYVNTDADMDEILAGKTGQVGEVDEGRDGI